MSLARELKRGGGAAAALVFAGLIWAAGAAAQGHPSGTLSVAAPQHRAAAAQAGLSAQDKDFLINAAKETMLQIELGKVAAARAQNPQLRQFAMLSIKYLGRVKGRLWTIAQEFSVILPPAVPDEAVKLQQSLSSETGANVDKDFVHQVVPANALAISLFNSEAQNAKNPVVLQFAREMLPRLHQRQQMLLRFAQGTGEPRGPHYARR